MDIRPELVLRTLASAGKRSIPSIELAERLGLSYPIPPQQAFSLREILEDLEAQGLVLRLPGGKWRATSDRRRIKKWLEQREKALEDEEGFQGFQGEGFMPEGPEPFPVEPTQKGWVSMGSRGSAVVFLDDGRQAYLSGSAIGEALHGDRVEVALFHGPTGLEAFVLSSIERGIKRVGGTLVHRGGLWRIEPHDPRLPPFFVVEGTPPLEARHGLEVLGQITHWPTASDPIPRARVLRVLGPRGSVAVEIDKLLAREGIESEFPPEAIAEALALPSAPDPAEIARRVDLREFCFVTIDPKDARDHDDAVWATRTPKGYRVIVAIADVSHYVPPGSAIDREAFARGC
ncbi:MAG: RNB domain-containing ribonuclease, partial [Sandaracinaceae bacterium]|nr:RNB domain-containing ribonuclease [Sandaracinaceae bacterium]